MTTSRFGFLDPPTSTGDAGLGDDYIRDLQSRIEAIGFRIQKGTFAARPATGALYEAYIATDANRVFLGTGTAWWELAGVDALGRSTLNAQTVRQRVTALPSTNLVDGLEVILQDNALTFGLEWTFRYKLGATNPWRLVNDGPWVMSSELGFNGGACSDTNGWTSSLNDDGAPAPITTPLAGVWQAYQDVGGVRGDNGTPYRFYWSVCGSAEPASTAGPRNAVSSYAAASGVFATGGGSPRANCTVAAGESIRPLYLVGGSGAVRFYNKRLWARPVAVSG